MEKERISEPRKPTRAHEIHLDGRIFEHVSGDFTRNVNGHDIMENAPYDHEPNIEVDPIIVDVEDGDIGSESDCDSMKNIHFGGSDNEGDDCFGEFIDDLPIDLDTIAYAISQDPYLQQQSIDEILASQCDSNNRGVKTSECRREEGNVPTSHNGVILASQKVQSFTRRHNTNSYKVAKGGNVNAPLAIIELDEGEDSWKDGGKNKIRGEKKEGRAKLMVMNEETVACALNMKSLSFWL